MEWQRCQLTSLGHLPHHIKYIQHFIEHIKAIQHQQEQGNVWPLVMSRPSSHQYQWTLPPLSKNKLKQDSQLHNGTSMSIQHIITWLEFCLINTYFLFQGKYLEQVHGEARGSPISPLVASLFMEEFKVKAINTAPNPPRLCLWHVDDTFVTQQGEHSHQFLQHINSMNQHIQFTTENPKDNDSIPFGYPSFPRTQLYPYNLSIQETHSDRQALPLGQPKQPFDQVKCLQSP